MAKCFSLTASRNSCYRYSFTHSGLKSSTVDLGDGTVMHCWVPKTHKPNKPTICLLHGIGANAMWQWADFISPLISKFNVYVPDLLFFGDSYTARPERSEYFQAQCVMGLLEAHGVARTSVVGISYGGFVGYSMAAMFREKVERVVLICAGVCLEEQDMDSGLFKVMNVNEAAEILFPQRPEKMRQLLKLTFYKPPKNIPSCFFNDYIGELDSGKTIGSAEMRYDLYIFKGEKPLIRQAPKSSCVFFKIQFVSNSRVNKDNDVLLWHYRLGHPNFIYLAKLFPSVFINKNPKSFCCEVWQFSKHTRSNYSSITYKPSHHFSLIHSVVWGPSKVKNILGKRWFVSFIDDRTRLT